MSRRTALGVLAALLTAGACPRALAGPPQKLRVCASFYPLFFFASRIGGDRAEVFNVTPPGEEPHDYEPTPRDMARIERCGLLVLNGIVEPWGEKVRRVLAARPTRIVVAGQGLATRRWAENGESAADPHVWLSPPLAARLAGEIERGLAAADPADAAVFAVNARALEARLRALDAEYRRGLARCSRREVVVSHAAFAYLAARYGLRQVPIGGLSPDAEPSPRRLAGIVNLARKDAVQVIFSERLVSPKLSQVVAGEIGARTMPLDPIEGLSEEGVAAGEDYFTRMRQNLSNLRLALGCP